MGERRRELGLVLYFSWYLRVPIGLGMSPFRRLIWLIERRLQLLENPCPVGRTEV